MGVNRTGKVKSWELINAVTSGIVGKCNIIYTYIFNLIFEHVWVEYLLINF